MKQALLSLLFFVAAVPVFSQTAAKKEPSCYEAYKKEFDERGAYSVDDGKYTGVVVSIISSEGVDCVSGKVQVEGGYVTSIWLQFEDNTYEYLDRKYKSGSSSKAKIVNGITEPLVTTLGETIYVIFVDKIKPKKKQLKKVTGPGNGF